MNEIIVKDNIKIENLIYEIRGKQVMLDSDLAMLFGYETKQLNRQVLRNINRFPENYCFLSSLGIHSYLNSNCKLVLDSKFLILEVMQVRHVHQPTAPEWLESWPLYSLE